MRMHLQTENNNRPPATHARNNQVMCDSDCGNNGCILMENPTYTPPMARVNSSPTLRRVTNGASEGLEEAGAGVTEGLGAGDAEGSGCNSGARLPPPNVLALPPPIVLELESSAVRFRSSASRRRASKFSFVRLA